MTKKRTMNELRQTKDTHYTNPSISSNESKKYLDIAGDDFMIKEAKDLIVNNLQNYFYDIIFEAVSDEMSKNYLFDSSEYLTEAGLELFEDAWFEWYHEHHGDIVSRVLKRLEP